MKTASGLTVEEGNVEPTMAFSGRSTVFNDIHASTLLFSTEDICSIR